MEFVKLTGYLGGSRSGLKTEHEKNENENEKKMNANLCNLEYARYLHYIMNILQKHFGNNTWLNYQNKIISNSICY